MAYDVVVVGAGIGGLTAGALLSARGLKVCVLERDVRAGGCAGAFEKFGYTFEQGAGLYASWQAGEIHERIFDELPTSAPEVHPARPAYVVRLPDETEIAIGGSTEAEFAATLARAFPECADAAVAFYRELRPICESLQRAARRTPHLATASRLERIRLMASEARTSRRILSSLNDTALDHLRDTSARFRRFVDAQLQIFAQTASDRCPYLYAAVALMQPLLGMYTMRGGAQTLADSLVEAIRQSGGEVRFGATALRLAAGADARARGVVLLSGETIEARRAIVSNLTIWDTYGKLIGLNSTPPRVRADLKRLRGWGAYLVYLGMAEAAASELTAERLLLLDDWQERSAFDAESSLMMLSVAPASDARAPAGVRAATLSTFTDAEGWFSFHADETEHERQDQSRLELIWQRLHRALPRLGERVEVIETATPRTFYEQTRRKLGMVGGLGQSLEVFGENFPTHRTPLDNLYMVGDTVFPGQGLAAVSQSALIVANEIAPPSR